MTTEEQARHRMYDRLVELLGDEHATTLMRYFPPTEDAELAGRADVQDVRAELQDVRAELGVLGDRLEHRIERLEDRVDHQTRTFVVTSIGSLATLGALAFAAARLI
jgi:hypothetical protein